MDRPLERRTAARTAVVWDAVREALGADGGRPDQRVLDIGGGTGGFAVRVAELGHQVTVVDPSPDALAALARRAHDDGVADRVTAVQGDLEGLGGLGADGSFDLVLCHGVLGLVQDPRAALGVTVAALRPGGTLSLLVGQHHAAVVARAMAGHFAQARELLDGRTPDRRFTAPELVDLLEQSGLAVAEVQGVRVFTDLVPSSLLDLEPGASASLLELERAVATRPEYRTLASQLHVLATR
jgi:S-adenosylmethionine-dependent methyltransferase